MDNITVLNIVMAKVWGGGEQYVYDTALAMKKRGIKVYIAVDESNVFMQEQFSKVAIVVTCDLYSFVGLKSIAKLKTFIRENKVTTLNVHSGRSMLLAICLKKCTNVELVVFKHNAVASKNDFYHKWQRKNVDAYICVSKLVYDLQVMGIECTNKYYLIYNGINLDKFNLITEQIEKRKYFTIGYAGRIAPDKGIDILLHAFTILANKYEDVKLLIAGSSEKEYLTRVLTFIEGRNLKDKIEYLGYIDDMNLFYKKIDVLVLPSIVKEAFGLVLCEAMYCGIPVVTTDSGAQKEIIENGIDGFIVEKDNINTLEECIEKIYNHSFNMETIRKNAREKVLHNFDIEKCVDKIMEVYYDCLNRDKYC